MKNSTKITNASIESAGLPKDARQVIAEYVWNGFDAKATSVSIDLQTDRKAEILPIVEQAIPLSDKERERIEKILN